MARRRHRQRPGLGRFRVRAEAVEAVGQADNPLGVQAIGLVLNVYRRDNLGQLPEKLDFDYMRDHSGGVRNTAFTRADLDLTCPAAAERGIPLPHYEYDPGASSDKPVLWDKTAIHVRGRVVLLRIPAGRLGEGALYSRWLKEDDFQALTTQPEDPGGSQ